LRIVGACFAITVDFTVVEIIAGVVFIISIISAIILDGIIRIISGPGSNPGIVVLEPPCSS
jgi:hypothetical protein